MQKLKKFAVPAVVFVVVLTALKMVGFHSGVVRYATPFGDARITGETVQAILSLIAAGLSTYGPAILERLQRPNKEIMKRLDEIKSLLLAKGSVRMGYSAYQSMRELNWNKFTDRFMFNRIHRAVAITVRDNPPPAGYDSLFGADLTEPSIASWIDQVVDMVISYLKLTPEQSTFWKGVIVLVVRLFITSLTGVGGTPASNATQKQVEEWAQEAEALPA